MEGCRRQRLMSVARWTAETIPKDLEELQPPLPIPKLAPRKRSEHCAPG